MYIFSHDFIFFFGLVERRDFAAANPDPWTTRVVVSGDVGAGVTMDLIEVTCIFLCVFYCNVLYTNPNVLYERQVEDLPGSDYKIFIKKKGKNKFSDATCSLLLLTDCLLLPNQSSVHRWSGGEVFRGN